MQVNEELEIIGLDKARPPNVSKKTYIDLFFQLSHEAPKLWCDIFNDATSKMQPSIKIDNRKGLFIDTYVRQMEEIPVHLELIKGRVAEANERYAEKIRQIAIATASDKASGLIDESPQGRLNAIIAGLDFGKKAD